MRIVKLLIIGICVVFSAIDCSRVASIIQEREALSPRETYLAHIGAHEYPSLRWQAAYERAITDSLQISLPYVMHGQWHEDHLFALGYEVYLERGRQLWIENRTGADLGEIFVEIFESKGLERELQTPLLSQTFEANRSISLPVEGTGWYKILIQPALYLKSSFSLCLYDAPAFLFPVTGANNRSIQSFWGDPRDGGKRKHHGVDIFAKRGTPIVAVADGMIRYRGERGLGGKQVWLRENIFNHSIYYAHLDSILPRPGRRVNRGDTLGFVGNTGNARFTPPHLHFGIYRRRKGPVDPLDFIKLSDAPSSDFKSVSLKGQVLSNRRELRKGPGKKFAVKGRLGRNEVIQILGKADNWYQVAVSDGLQGYMNQSAILEIAH